MKKVNIIYVIVFVVIVGCLTYLLFLDTEGETTNNLRYNVDMEPEALTSIELETSLVGYGAKGALADEDLTIMDMLTYSVQDEYLAHGEYVAIMNAFGEQRPYSNIELSEETHLAYLKEVYKSYDMDFPSDESSDHIVIPESLLEAAETGVKAEIDNIAMYEKFFEYDLPDNVYSAFVILKEGSENHLRAFQRQVELLK